MQNQQLTIAISYSDATQQERAAALAQELHLPLATTDTEKAGYKFLLEQSAQHLAIHWYKEEGILTFVVEYLTGSAAHRRQFGGSTRQLIARAVGFKKDYHPTIIDATGGFGRDGFVLASIGCQVKLLEQSPFIYALTADGISRLNAEEPDIKLSVEHIDALHFLPTLQDNEKPDVIYLDPMYPARSKSAMVKKASQFLQALTASYPMHEHQLLFSSLEHAKKRVVVKRPNWAGHLANFTPNITYQSKTTRFDVYTCGN